MGKKRRMIAKRQKFGAKFANHPRIATLSNQEQIEELVPVAEEVPTPVLEKVVAELKSVPEPKSEFIAPKPEKVTLKATTARKKKAVTKTKTNTTRAKKTTSKK